MGSPLLVKTLNRAVRAIHRYLVTGRFRAEPGPIIKSFFGGKPCFFVQVGSSDGVMGDPLYHLIKTNPQWRGLFIEPMQETFDSLVGNHGRDGRFAFEQIAIDEVPGERPFYFVPQQSGIAREMLTVSSLERSHVADILAKLGTLELLSVRNVRCEPLMSVLGRLKIERVDLLHIDAESYDYRVLRQLDFARFRPRLVLYEHCNLSAGDAIAARALLRREGYSVVECGRDTVAVLARPAIAEH